MRPHHDLLDAGICEGVGRAPPGFVVAAHFVHTTQPEDRSLTNEQQRHD